MLKLVDSNQKISKDIARAMTDSLNTMVNKNSSRVKKQIQNIIPTWVREQPEIQEILQEATPGSLNAQLGFYQGTTFVTVEAVVKAVESSITLKFKPFNTKFQGGLEFLIQPSTFANLLSLPEGTIITSMGTRLEWLDWMLMKGSATIVTGYTYTPNLDGRSGGGVMQAGKTWRIPTAYSGTPSNNFITRALSGKEKQLSTILRGLLD